MVDRNGHADGFFACGITAPHRPGQHHGQKGVGASVKIPAVLYELLFRQFYVSDACIMIRSVVQAAEILFRFFGVQRRFCRVNIQTGKGIACLGLRNVISRQAEPLGVEALPRPARQIEVQGAFEIREHPGAVGKRVSNLKRQALSFILPCAEMVIGFLCIQHDRGPCVSHRHGKLVRHGKQIIFPLLGFHIKVRKTRAQFLHGIPQEFTVHCFRQYGKHTHCIGMLRRRQIQHRLIVFYHFQALLAYYNLFQFFTQRQEFFQPGDDALLLKKRW